MVLPEVLWHHMALLAHNKLILVAIYICLSICSFNLLKIYVGETDYKFRGFFCRGTVGNFRKFIWLQSWTYPKLFTCQNSTMMHVCNLLIWNFEENCLNPLAWLVVLLALGPSGSGMPMHEIWLKPLSKSMMTQLVNKYMHHYNFGPILQTVNKLIPTKILFALIIILIILPIPNFAHIMTAQMSSCCGMPHKIFGERAHNDGLVEGCSNSSALALELLQSCIKPW